MFDQALKISVLFLLCFVQRSWCIAQQKRAVIGTATDYKLSVKGGPGKEMVNLLTYIPGLHLDIRYTTANNCTHTILYNRPSAYMRRNAAAALKAVQQELMKYKMSLVIYDAYRPFSATQKIWDVVKDERYAARPVNGSGHNRGLSVDVSLFSTELNKPVDMGTDFDNFSDSASIHFRNISSAALANRQRLRSIMIKHGFKPLNTEWWHFSWPDTNDCEVLDITMDVMQDISN